MIIGIDAKSLSKKRAGIGFYVENIVKYLSENDKDNTYYLYSNKELNLNFDLPSNFCVKYYKAKVASLYITYCLKKRLEKDGIDLFWGPEHVLPKKSKKYKMVVTIHDLANFKIKNIGKTSNVIIQKLFVKKSCKNADKIIAISNSTKKDIHDIFRIDNNKIEMVYNGYQKCEYDFDEFDVNKKNEILHKYKINGDYFVFVSTIEPRKNIINLVKGYEIYRNNTKSNDKLVLVGGLGWKYDETLIVIKNSDYCNDIILTGYVTQEDKNSLIYFSKCVVFVSLYEGFGFPILDGFSLGKNVITSNVSSMPEVGGELCTYVNEPTDINEIAFALKNYKEFDKKDLISTANLFSISKCCENTLIVFNKNKDKNIYES